MESTPRSLADLVAPDGSSVDRRVFADQEVYAAELERIFARSWLYLAHESQLAAAGDFLTTTMGETPVIVARLPDGGFHASVNSCSHRGLPVCRADAGNARGFVCPYHAWTYGLDGALVAVPQERKVARIDRSGLGLPPVPRLESYRGFLFGSFAAEIEPLVDYLGEMAFYLDAHIDRFPGGIEVIGPAHRWLLQANWKLPYENQLGDLGHASYLHGALLGAEGSAEAETFGLTMVPKPGHSANIRLMPEDAPPDQLAWGMEGASLAWPEPVRRYLLEIQAEAAARLGPLRARIKGLIGGVYPNFNFLWSNNSIRVSHPRGPGRTEFWSWWVAPKAAPEEVKTALRTQYNYLFGPAGIVEQEDSEAWAQQWIGASAPLPGPRAYFYGLGAGEEGPHPDLPGVAGKAFNEHYARAFYRRWRGDLLAGAGR
jgi:phenylpropionate dioxygenase-like ring-hydroxylating dioxygenase large terminal subunit